MTDLLGAARLGFDPDAIADALGRHRPTAEQAEVIAAPLEPALVVAGAGSGKTETMAGRVLWLLANEHVEAGEVLGLTFTRKAAAELGERITSRVGALAAVGGLPDHDPFVAPVVATYNSFANTIYREHAPRLGLESDAAVLSAASAWRLARQVVLRSTSPDLAASEKSPDAITQAVLALSGALAEHAADPADAERFAHAFASVQELPLGGRHEYGELMECVRAVGSLPMLLELVEAYGAEKVRRGVVEYSDQVGVALRIVERFPEVAAELRARFRVVLLDEYQDTSVVQARLLAALFHGHGVMAVGDPHQSIYGWRGASAANLDAFADQFGGGSAVKYTLSTSWRNGLRVLDAANAIASPLTATARVSVPRLQPAPTASDHRVQSVFAETVVEEAAAVAAFFRAGLDADPEVSGALLMRTRKTLPYFLDAFRAAGVRFHVLGVGGLLQQPDVADIVCALAVIADPSADSELVRLLAGSRWRIGVADLDRLRSVARWLGDRDANQRLLDEVVRERMRSSFEDEDGATLIDALDFVARVREDHTVLGGFSDFGRARLREAGALFARLRERAGMDLADLVVLVQQELLLDIELRANEQAASHGDHVDALLEAIGDYEAADDGELRGFLSWLREAERRDDLMPRPEDPEPGAVQVLTIHAAKGLEWDRVAVVRLVADELPLRAREGKRGWLAFGVLPYELRGDAAELPLLAWRGAADRAALKKAWDVFGGEVLEHQLREERRLAYVAVTRARHHLLLSGSFWATQVRPRTPSRFLGDLVAAGLIEEPPGAPAEEENPLGEQQTTFLWPRDPLGSRRDRVEQAAELVRDMRPGQAGAFEHDLRLLLEERRRRAEPVLAVPLPPRIAASRFKEFVTDPAAAAERIRRPMPERPFRASRLGTVFHAWVEARYGMAGGADLVDDADGLGLDGFDGLALDGLGSGRADGSTGADDDALLARWQATFAASRWAQRAPVEVEREVHILIGGHPVVCKIDAVFERDGRFELVDWKTGRLPKDDADLEARALQLSLYRAAYARWRGIDADLVDAVFYFVDADTEVRPHRLIDDAELEQLLGAVLVDGAAGATTTEGATAGAATTEAATAED